MACNGCQYTISEFLTLIRDECKLNNFLNVHNVLTDEKICPKCNKSCKFNPNENTFQCSTAIVQSKGHKKRTRLACGFSVSASKSTYFENSELPISEICKFITFWVCVNFSQHDLEEEIKWSSLTVVNWMSFCREVCFSNITKNSEKLGGNDRTVELHEVKFGKQKYTNRIIQGQWVFGGIERNTNKNFLIPVLNRSKETLLEIINEWVLPGTTIMSHCWKEYDCLNDEGFLHQTVNHSKNFVDPDARSHTRRVERMFSDKNDDVHQYGQQKSHFANYLAEYYFRCKYSRLVDRLHNFFICMADVSPPKGNQHGEDDD
ncbi:hypothetical protein WA026_002455 [Henosepilachna vigintioctopunctata]|uniref:ISXO2-like transposase domain-containing protein n=1 Tax=Henosepilachna vigintioctopunctata TaxID=420089 RepID=A0AAW1U0T7_9CUCU